MDLQAQVDQVVAQVLQVQVDLLEHPVQVDQVVLLVALVRVVLQAQVDLVDLVAHQVHRVLVV